MLAHNILIDSLHLVLISGLHPLFQPRSLPEWFLHTRPYHHPHISSSIMRFRFQLLRDSRVFSAQHCIGKGIPERRHLIGVKVIFWTILNHICQHGKSFAVRRFWHQDLCAEVIQYQFHVEQRNQTDSHNTTTRISTHLRVSMAIVCVITSLTLKQEKVKKVRRGF